MDVQKTLQEKCLTNWRGMVIKTGDCITPNFMTNNLPRMS